MTFFETRFRTYTAFLRCCYWTCIFYTYIICSLICLFCPWC